MSADWKWERTLVDQVVFLEERGTHVTVWKYNMKEKYWSPIFYHYFHPLWADLCARKNLKLTCTSCCYVVLHHIKPFRVLLVCMYWYIGALTLANQSSFLSKGLTCAVINNLFIHSPRPGLFKWAQHPIALTGRISNAHPSVALCIFLYDDC